MLSVGRTETEDTVGVKRETVRDVIMYEYSKLIADAAVGRRSSLASVRRAGDDYWSFVTATFGKLARGDIQPSKVLRENKLLVAEGNSCAYCGTESDSLQWEHIIPSSKGGPDTIDNLVLACSSCNAKKGARDPFEWYEGRRAEIPRIVLGKLLKQLLAAHEAAGTLAWAEYPNGQGLKASQLVRVFAKRRQ